MNNLTYITWILVADIVAILLDQIVLRKLAGHTLGWAYYLYIVLATILFSLVIYNG
ncbi:hypothetical protein [Lactobacillus sp. PV037]|uniref:hypothetical protein n=1 Tax=Lactobacillus sp. PV037 TaxID=2594496 RepID=UPI00223FF685|nr:hypothetical protein [Lactobacillus sp. PV037]